MKFSKNTNIVFYLDSLLKYGLVTFTFYLVLISQLFALEDLPDNYQYVFPLPNSINIHPTSTIIVRFNDISPLGITNLSNMVEVVGEKSGYHNGKTHIALDGRTIIFESNREYELGETIKVKIEPSFKKLYKIDIISLNYEFEVMYKEVSPSGRQNYKSSKPTLYNSKLTNNPPKIMSNGVSVPSDFPHVEISQNDSPSGEYIFLNNWGPPNYNIIFDTSGVPVWYLKTIGTRRDFKVQKNDWITMLVRGGYGASEWGYIAFNENFEFIKVMRTTNGYTTDEHELFMLPDSGYFLIGRRDSTVDMSQIVSGGKTDAVVRETCIQEFTSDDELIFIWRAWDHFDIRDLDLESLTDSYIRFPHMNSIYIDEDGHILLSSRHLSEISKINRHSGEFIWRMCGVPQSENNDFQFVNDAFNGFRNQHAISSLGNNRYLLFDNGNLHSPPTTRAVEYEIDPVQKTATLVWEFRNDVQYTWSSYMGNTQRLPNGNTHINYSVGGQLPIAQEVTIGGEKKFEMRFEEGYRSYRSFRHHWDGTVNTPYLIVEAPQGTLTLIFNKFGDDNIAYFNIYAETLEFSKTIIDTSFGTIKQLTNLTKGLAYNFWVTAVNNDGIESEFSNEETFFIDEWIIGVTLATPNITSIVANQGNVQLSWNSSYGPVAGYNIYRSTTQNFSPENNKLTSVSSNVNNYTDVLPNIMANTTYYYRISSYDSNGNESDYSEEGSTTTLKINSTKVIPVEYSLNSNYPNPFNPITNINYNLPVSSIVSIIVYSMDGQEITKLQQDETMEAGVHTIKFDGSNLASGIYFYTLTTKTPFNSKTFTATKKMLLIK